MASKKKEFVQNQGNNAICYYRYSSTAQRDVSIDDQKNAAHEYAAAHGYHIIKEYEDHAISGTTDDRPQYQLMLYEVEKLRPAYLILWKTDRLSRDRIDSTIAKKRLRDCGVKIEYVAEAIPEDDASALIIESIYEAMAEMFIIGHRKNVKRGLTGNANKCWYNGKVVLGYKGKPNEPYKIDEDTAPIVKRVFEDYADGKPLQQICNDLNDAGLRSTKGNEFTVNSLRHILTNRSYIGEYRWGEVVKEDGMPRIVDDELFEQVQKRLEQNKRGGKGALRKLESNDTVSDYWLTNHIYCKECGGTMQGIAGTSKSGKLHYYYACKNHRKHKCKLKSQRKDLLEKIVNYVLEDLMHDPTVRLVVADKCYSYYLAQSDSGDSFEETIKARIREVDKKLDNFVRAIENGIFNSHTQERMKELEVQKSLLTDELIAEQNRKQFILKPNQVVKYLDSFFDKAKKEDLLDYLVDKIYVGNDKLTIVFHYTDDARELPYDETVKMIESGESLKSMDWDGVMTPELAVMLDSLINPDSGSGKKKGRKKKDEGPDFFQ